MHYQIKRNQKGKQDVPKQVKRQQIARFDGKLRAPTQQAADAYTGRSENWFARNVNKSGII